jgi:hypothetical protein
MPSRLIARAVIVEFCVGVCVAAVGCASHPPQLSSEAGAASGDRPVAATPAAVVRAATDAGGTGTEDPVERYLRAARADLSRGKVQIITSVMSLSASEAKVFWPIYEDYEQELFDLGDERLALIRRFAAAQRNGALDDDGNARDIAAAFFDLQARQLELLKKYFAIIADKMSPVRAAQFAQVEHRVNTVVDLMIAAEVPLVRDE